MEVVAPKLDTSVHGYECGRGLSPPFTQRERDTWDMPTSIPTDAENHRTLARTEPQQIVTMTLSVYYVPESGSQIIISTQGKDMVYKELSSQTMLFEV